MLEGANHKTPRELLGSLVFLIGASCAVIMVFQGFHLWNTGWEGLNMDAETTGRLAAKKGGRGGIVILAINFLPQFLVFGYGGALWASREIISRSVKVLRGNMN